jgi:hypothetical protein
MYCIVDHKALFILTEKICKTRVTGEFPSRGLTPLYSRKSLPELWDSTTAKKGKLCQPATKSPAR